MDVTKPYELMGPGAMKPFIRAYRTSWPEVVDILRPGRARVLAGEYALRF